MSYWDNLVEETYLGNIPGRITESLERIAEALDNKGADAKLTASYEHNIKLEQEKCRAEVENDLLKAQLKQARNYAVGFRNLAEGRARELTAALGPGYGVIAKVFEWEKVDE